MSAFSIAQQLSAGAKDALLAFPPAGIKYYHEREHIPFFATLARLNLAEKRWTTTNDNPWEITPLGAEVQELLQKNPPRTDLQPTKCPWGCKPVIKERSIPASDPRFPDRTSFEIVCRHAHLVGDAVLIPGQKEHDDLVRRWNSREGDESAEAAKVMRVLLPPASNVTGDYLSGWCEGQAYLIANYGDEASSDEAISTAALCDVIARVHVSQLGTELPTAIAQALYGPQFDPHTNPEAFDFCETAASAALAKVNQVPPRQVSDLSAVAKAICIALKDDPEREGPWDTWWMQSRYAEAAIAIQTQEQAEIERLRKVLALYSEDTECGMCETLVTSGALARNTLGEEA
jgi:hypothetical protein